MKAKIPRIMFASTSSGSGKTTITIAVLKSLMNNGLNVAAFKTGPDYIDPMFHSRILGAKSRNLDLFMLNENTCKYLLAKNSIGADISVLEGVMGYYDGLGINSTSASSYNLANVTKTPVILVVNCKGAALSIAALIKGFKEFKIDSNIKGVILNNLSQHLYTMYKEMIESNVDIKVVGFLPNIEECKIQSRHLGLITADEIEDLHNKIDILGEKAEKCINIDEIVKISTKVDDIEYKEPTIKKVSNVNIAIARDKAFCFYYQDSLELLEDLGANIQYFSPLKDKSLPECDGLILGGGYPEIYAKALSENITMKQSIKNAIDNKLPCIAECGGFMYLLDDLKDKEGTLYKMVGAIKGTSFMTNKLSRFGYITLKSNTNNLLGKCGEQINAHEFHHSDSINNGNTFMAKKPSTGKTWDCINSSKTLFAGYPHIHFWSNVDFATRFIKNCGRQKSE